MVGDKPTWFSTDSTDPLSFGWSVAVIIVVCLTGHAYYYFVHKIIVLMKHKAENPRQSLAAAHVSVRMAGHSVRASAAEGAE